MSLRILAVLILAASASSAVAAPPRKVDCTRCHQTTPEAVRAALAMSTPVPEPLGVVGAGKADDIPRGHKLLYRLARNRAVDDVMAAKKVSRAKAKELIDRYADDDSLHALAMEAGLKIAAAPKEGGRLESLLDWLLAHQDQILALIKLILTLLAFIDHDLGEPLDWFAAA